MRASWPLVICAMSLIAGSCALGGEPLTIDQPSRVVPRSSAPGGAEIAQAGPETETIQAPAFNIELSPGQDPSEVLGLTPGSDSEAISPDPGASASATGPADALISLCPALERLVTGDVGDTTDDELATLTAATPPQWHAHLSAASEPALHTPGPSTSALDAFYYDTCSIPLFSGAAQLSSTCGSDEACVMERIEAELHGLCFEEGESAGASRSFALVNWASGLPA